MRIHVLALWFGIACLIAGRGPAAAQDPRAYPTGTVRIVVPYVPGGTSDTLTRAIAQKLGEKWGKPVVVDNRPGANGIIGIEHTARSAPDGYTLVVAEGATFTINPSLYAKLPYDPVKDFAPITRITSYGVLLVVHPSVPANSVGEFIALARAKPGVLTYGSFGIGSGGHLNMEAFKLLEGLDIVHVPYKGSAPVVTDLVAGRISSVLISVSSAREHVESGELKALGYANPTRTPILPNVPTFAEAGITDYDATTWFAMMAPAGTPTAIVGKIHDDVVSTINDPVFKEQWYTRRGQEAVSDTPEELAARIKSEIPMWAKVIKAAGATLD